MKMCKRCKTEKTLSEYYKTKATKDGHESKCKACRKEEGRLVYRKRKELGDEITLKDLTKPPIGYLVCNKCEETKLEDEFNKCKSTISGRNGECKSCTALYRKKRLAEKGDRIREVRRAWKENNHASHIENARKYRAKNREKFRLKNQRRRAMVKSLPHDLTESEMKGIFDAFGGKCAICERDADSLDHFIPIASGHGGTTLANMLPLCQSMNSSKMDKNPFEWADSFLDGSSKIKFDTAVEYLSNLNGLSVDEYREFVFSCFKNTKI